MQPAVTVQNRRVVDRYSARACAPSKSPGVFESQMPFHAGLLIVGSSCDLAVSKATGQGKGTLQ